MGDREELDTFREELNVLLEKCSREKRAVRSSPKVSGIHGIPACGGDMGFVRCSNYEESNRRCGAPSQEFLDHTRKRNQLVYFTIVPFADTEAFDEKVR